MLGLLFATILGLVFAYFAVQNATIVNIDFANYTLPNVPLYAVAIGSLLLGFVISTAFALGSAITNFFSLHSRDSRIQETNSALSKLKDRIRELEIENSKLRGQTHAPVTSPNLLGRIRDRFSYR